MQFPQTRLARLPEGAPLDYEPDNEQGVIYLISQQARRHGLHIESVRAGFPDCKTLDFETPTRFAPLALKFQSPSGRRSPDAVRT